MSKLSDLYFECKKKNSNKIYLFKNGNFYICLGEDAIILNKELDLKLINFTNNLMKCGFPINVLNKYTKFINLLNYEYEIIYSNISDYIINEIKSVDIVNADEALEKLREYKRMITDE